MRLVARVSGHSAPRRAHVLGHPARVPATGNFLVHARPSEATDAGSSRRERSGHVRIRPNLLRLS